MRQHLRRGGHPDQRDPSTSAVEQRPPAHGYKGHPRKSLDVEVNAIEREAVAIELNLPNPHLQQDGMFQNRYCELSG